MTGRPVQSAPYECGNCDSPVNSDAAHAPCGHGYMTGCPDCGTDSSGGEYYFLASDPKSGPPCQGFINEVEISILAGSAEYQDEYRCIRARWSDIRAFTSALAHIPPPDHPVPTPGRSLIPD